MELKPLFTYAEDTERELSPVFPDIEDTKVELEPLLTDTEDSSNSDSSSSESNPMTTEQKFTLVSLSISYAFSSAFYSMLGPIYPQEAKRKGVSQLMTGLIFGVHALVVFATSPFFGKYMYRIGAKFMLIVGLLVAGISNVIFGFLDDSPDGFVYVVLCLIVRTLEGLGCSAFETAGFAIMAYTFPSRVSTMFGIIEAVIGFGFMVGPVIGGALYQVGGFKLPFILSGALVIIVAIVCIWLLPSTQGVAQLKGSILPLFKMPITFILYHCIFAGAVVVSFLDISFALHLKPLHLSPILVGAVFLISGGVYALLSPLVGYILDKTGWYKRSMALGGLLALVAFSLMGPSPFLFLPKDSLWLNIVASVVLGISFCTLLIPPLQELVTAAIKSGYPENLDTYGITSGLYKSAFYIGTFAGSVGGGFILDKIGFSWTALLTGLIGVSCTLLLALYGAVKMFCSKPTKDGCLI